VRTVTVVKVETDAMKIPSFVYSRLEVRKELVWGPGELVEGTVVSPSGMDTVGELENESPDPELDGKELPEKDLVVFAKTVSD
jgi:hypothetical protein